MDAKIELKYKNIDFLYLTNFKLLRQVEQKINKKLWFYIKFVISVRGGTPKYSSGVQNPCYATAGELVLVLSLDVKFVNTFQKNSVFQNALYYRHASTLFLVWSTETWLIQNRNWQVLGSPNL
jgi:hypothetical protein